MKKYVFFDFNGTLIDDVELCLELLNDVLRMQGAKELTLAEYRDIFTFPVIKYYELAGIDFKKNTFKELADYFISNYQPRSMECGLIKGTYDVLNYLKAKGYSLVMLSASYLKNLLEQTENYKITEYFDDILGLDNINASSKVQIAIDYMKNKNIDPKTVLMVGDTLHDLEVSKEIGAECYLVASGHQSISVLKTGNVLVLDSIKDLCNIL